MVKQRIFYIMSGAVLLVCLGSIALAGSRIRIFLNGQELKTKIPPQIVNGNVMAPLPVIAELFGAAVKWNEKTNSVDIETKEREAQKIQVGLLEQALAAKDPLTAAKTWAEGVKIRNGALQYAVMSPDLKKESYAGFVESNWCTGVSSPWVESYNVIERNKAGQEQYLFEVEFTYTDSTKSSFSTKEYVTVGKFNGDWFVSSIEKIEVKGEIVKAAYYKDKKVKSVFVQDKAGVNKGYDRANVIIDDKTKIYKGYTDQEFAASDLREGAVVEVALTGDPVTMIYPVSARAKTIRVMEPQQAGTFDYRNDQYGFSFSLPESWKGYEIVTEKWEGRSVDDGANGKIMETGPIIKIRHPQWTSQNPRQDIPIMVFTITQWDLMQQGKFHIGAAPMGPKEIGRNSKYVFALPARYNYAFPTGYEEVEEILAGNPLKPMG